MKINEIVRTQQVDEGIANILKTLGRKAAPGAASSISGKVGKAVDYVKGGLKATAAGALDALQAASLWFIVKPIWDYNSKINEAKDRLDAGEIPTEKFNEIHDALLGEVIIQIAAGLAGTMFLRSVPAFLGLLRFIPGVGPLIATTISLLSEAQLVYFLEKVSSDEGRQMMATFIGMDHIKDVGSMGEIAIKYFKKIIKEAAGIKPDDEPETKPTDSANSNTSDTTKPSDTKPTDTKPTDSANTTSKPTDSANTNTAQDPNVYTPSHMRRDANGNLMLKYAD